MGQTGENSATGQFMPMQDVWRLVEEHRGAGRLDEAEYLLQQILRLRAEPLAIHYMGVIAHQRGNLSQAIEHVRQATELAPQTALFQANLGEMYRLAGRPDLAVQHGTRAIALQPNYPEALSNVGIAHYELKNYEKALASHRKAIKLDKSFAKAHSNCGNALHALKRFDEAVKSYRRAVELAPDFADGWANLGTSLHHSGHYEDGIAALRRALALDPDNANAHSGLGILLLMRGEFAEGWDEYEWRLKSTEVRLPYSPQRPWAGESLKGRHLYIHAEQGFGDTMQFARYVPLVAARAGAVTFRVQQGLAGLLRQSLPGIEVLGDRGKPANIPDYECALMSLPRIFGTRLETIPAKMPYLAADAGEAAKWRARFAGLEGLKVGLVWAGNPEHVNDMRRSVGLANLAGLFKVGGVSFVSLQVGPPAAELEKNPKLKILDVAADLVPFAATAAAMEALDLVITIDSSTVHLAGALGKPTWLLTPWLSDWRWLLGRKDNPWYPSLRLFRQARDEDWTDVVERVAGELRKAGHGKKAVLTPFREAGEKRAAAAAEIIAVQESRIVSPRPAPTLSPPQVLALAEQRRQGGKLAEAEMLARRVLDAAPDNAEAYHLLGIIAHQSGNLAHAIEHVKRAAQLAPSTALYHANLGEMMRLAGRTEEAIASSERALALQPEQAGALNNLGIANYEKGDFEKAITCYRRAIALNPGFTQAHSNLGNALRALKQLEEAVPCYRHAIELAPQFPDAWNNLGTTLRDLKKLDEAEQAYRKALTLKQDDPEVLNSLALCLKDLEKIEEAEACLKRSLAIESRNAKTLLYLATVLLDQHKTDEAAAAASTALALEPANHDIVNVMGRVAFERHDLAAAEAHYRRALEIKPDLPDALNNLGNVKKELGKLDEAREAFAQSLALDPNATGVYVNYADSVKFTAGNPHLKAMEEMRAGGIPLSDTDRIHLDFALSKAYADIKEPAKSFERMLSGNAIKRAQITYDEAATLGLFDRIENIFSEALLREKEKLGGGDPSPAPIFVFGMPRSGTTLVEQILASHPQVFGAGELKTLSEVVAEVRGPDGAPAPYPELATGLGAEAMGKIGARYLAEIRKLSSAHHVTDKMPSNYYFAGLIHLALPNARLVHVMRDPVDNCISCFSKLFSAEQSHTYDLAELGRYHRRYQKLMAHWRRVLPEGRILDVRYEDVVGDLETQARRIIAHCGLPWDAGCLSFHTTQRPVRTASASQVRQPLYKSAVGRAGVYKDSLGPLVDALAGK